MRFLRYGVGAGGLVLGLAMLSMPMAGCDVLDLGGSCRGAEGLRPEHEALLSCAGWYDFVYAHIGEIEYVQAFDLDRENEKEVTGQARCRSCRVRVADMAWDGLSGSIRPRSNSEIAAILVHEAAHLADHCKHGEAPAEQAEAAFRRDLSAQLPDIIQEPFLRNHPCWAP